MRKHLITALSMALFGVAPLATAAPYAFVGTYQPHGEGVYRFRIAPDGALSDKTQVSQLHNAAQLTANAQKKVLYAASESDPGIIVAYRLAEDGSLTEINQVSSAGSGPVYLTLTPDGRHLLVANYVSGSVAVLPVRADGGLEQASDHQQHQGTPGAAQPQAAVEGSFASSDHDGPHAHMIASDPHGRYVFSTDLGLDRIYQYRLSEQGKLMPNTPPWLAASSAGAGPRHFVFTPDGKALYLINEEASTLTHYRLDTQHGTLTEGATVSSLPPGYKGTSFAAGLAIDQRGKHLYVLNRLHNSIGHFRIEPNGTLTPIENVWTRGDYPRTLTLSEDGKTLYVLNQRSDNITRFYIDSDSGKLRFSDDYTAIGAPSQMVIMP
ncbi:6-phosphogluconolactonase [Mixta theicola]|uniref:6-phosphogluconolactonase n=1 Tax=Mixta theicola TaxID=1458355 RepID=A0A2K1QBG3_9GAMM|nr:lactonase family protein [Mixta theicola]PNS12364.1 6-phosphogluconolactonase [Mixta theicola]GLR08121.1 6-phosphogluconolactonase [Mixta theicola]